VELQPPRDRRAGGGDEDDQGEDGGALHL
jgi:hypothetical protein